MTPKVPGLFTAKPGLFQVGGLKPFKASAWICVLSFSLNLKFLKKEKSMLNVDGPRQVGREA